MIKKFLTANSNNRRGATLLELIITISLLTVVIGIAASAVFSAVQSYALTVRLQEDKYNIRMAALSISREIHRGVLEGGVSFSSGRLTLKTIHGGDVEFTFAGGELSRTKEGNSDIPFIAVKLSDFHAEEADGKVRLELTGEYTGKVGMTVAISRVPS